MRLYCNWLSVGRVCYPVKLHCSGRTVFLLKRIVTLAVCVPSRRCQGITGHGELAITSAAVMASRHKLDGPTLCPFITTLARCLHDVLIDAR